jgi:hypothetical protein
MKTLLSGVIACALFCSCNNATDSVNTKTDSSEVKTTAKETVSEPVSYPYEHSYSTKHSLGNPAHTKLVLDFYKLFETNKMDEMKPFLTDSVFVEFADGTTFNGPSDSLISMGKKYRAEMSNYSYKFDTWLPIHTEDTKEDWVLVWSRAYFTDKKGKQDSLRVHEYYQIKNNKICYWSEYNQKLPKPKKK